MKHSTQIVYCIIVIIGFCSFQSMKACTALLMKTNKTVLVGNNEDGSNPETRIWVSPRQNGQYGRLYFGFSDLSPQGGINEKGLWFDAFGLAYESPSAIKGEVYPGDLQDIMMAECATVEEVVVFLKKYNRSQMNRYQWMVGDKNGHSAIIEDDTIIYSIGNSQLITNFRQSKFPDGKGYDCLRYQTAMKMVQSNSAGSVNGMRKILAATHSEGDDVTLYSYIADLKNGLVYVYNFHNYEQAVVLNVADELKKGKHVYNLPELFPVTVAAEVFNYKMRSELSQKIEAKRYKDYDSSRLPHFCGTYKISMPLEMAGQTLTLSNEKEFINLQLNYGGPYKVFPQSVDEFSMMGYGGIDFTCRFTIEQNRAIKLSLSNPGLTVEAYRVE